MTFYSNGCIRWVVAVSYLGVKRSYHDHAIAETIAAVRAISEPGALITFGINWPPGPPVRGARTASMVSDQAGALWASPPALVANRAAASSSRS